tara:strand:- start:81 stop:860 length:780 start_codon:yes stop_codon:yes gene_type:complete
MKTKMKKRKSNTRDLPFIYGKFLFILFFIVASLVILKISHGYLAKSDTLPLKIVEINGNFIHLKEEEIEKKVSSMIDGGFFTVDMKNLRVKVIHIPWVEEVSIRRVWPDTLRMHIKEQVPIAHWGNSAYINAKSNIFSPVEIDLNEDLPKFFAKDEDAEKCVSFYRKFYSTFNNKNLIISELSLNDRQEWKIIFQNKLELMLGKDDINNRISNFINIYPKLLANTSRSVKSIDMRYEHGFAVAWGLEKISKRISLMGDS